MDIQKELLEKGVPSYVVGKLTALALQLSFPWLDRKQWQDEAYHLANIALARLLPCLDENFLMDHRSAFEDEDSETSIWDYMTVLLSFAHTFGYKSSRWNFVGFSTENSYAGDGLTTITYNGDEIQIPTVALITYVEDRKQLVRRRSEASELLSN